MSVSPLEKALAWFGERVEMGGFRTVGKELFAGWEPKRSCRAPHREDKDASFSVYRRARIEGRFEDFGTDEQGEPEPLETAPPDRRATSRYGAALRPHRSFTNKEIEPRLWLFLIDDLQPG